MEDELKKKVTEWVDEIFKDKGFDDLNIEFGNIDTSGGCIGEMIFVDVLGKKCGTGNNKKFELVIKKNKEKNEAFKKINITPLYKNEVNFFGKFIPILNKFSQDRNVTPLENIPYCYGVINRNEEYIILMENLKPKGFKMHHSKKPHDMNHMKLLLEAYAKFHAFSFALRDQNSGDIIEEFKNSSKELADVKLFTMLIPSVLNEIDFVIKTYKEKNKLDFIEKLEKLKENYGDLYMNGFLRGGDDKYYVLRHGDCYNNNFLFHYEEDGITPDKAIIVDWQVGLVGSPVIDLCHCLFYCSSSSVLKELDELLQFYYDNLSKKLLELGSNPEKCFPKDIFYSTFKKYAPFGIGGMTMCVKSRFSIEIENSTDLTEAIDNGDYSANMNVGLKDPDEYFKQINEILQISIEHDLI